ncbi:MAG: DUF4910 domain-containing protein [Hyphomonadaceae bacterium]|nr:DUF4910 domain-containing protein [Hyphomonadaceae bacterium]
MADAGALPGQTKMNVIREPLAEKLFKPGIGEEMWSFANGLYPYCRSITGNGVRQTLNDVKKVIDLTIHEVPSGTPVFDWNVPREWNIRDAWIKDPSGKKIVDFKVHNLHVLNYSTPINGKFELAELKKHIFTMPDQPDLIPYRTSYYHENWGFCMTHEQMLSLEDGVYEAYIDSDHDPNGSLTYGEYFIQGESDETILFSAHCCHPSLANDNCSGVSVNTHLARALASMKGKTRYSYVFIFAPGTIGSLTWLSRNGDRIKNIHQGLILSCVGDAGGPTYKRSQKGDALIDKAVEKVMRDNSKEPNIVDFWPYGYDERQYNSPAFRLNVGLMLRSRFGLFPEYHTSADNMDFIRPEYLEESYKTALEVIDIIENDYKMVNLSPNGEPNLGKRGLYGAVGGDKKEYDANLPMLWMLNQSDGTKSILDIALRAKLPFPRFHRIAKILEEYDLLEYRK